MYFIAIFAFFVSQTVSRAALPDENIIDTGCSSDKDCKNFQNSEIVNATCFNGNCICMENELRKVKCLPHKVSLSNEIGGICPCDIQWSSCVNGFCMCERNFVASNDKRRCLPKQVPIGNKCENREQCSRSNSFATCQNQTCSCSKGFTAHNGTCQSLVGLEEKCGPDSKCLLPNTLCTSERCVCEPGFVAKFDKTACLLNVDYNDGCSESVQCQEKLGAGAVCEIGKCSCGEHFIKATLSVDNETKTFCDNQVAIGDMCAYDTDCWQSRGNGTEASMKCFRSECQCEFGYEQDQDMRYCVESGEILTQSTWFDVTMTNFRNGFGLLSSSGCRSNFLNSLMAVVCIGLVIYFN